MTDRFFRTAGLLALCAVTVMTTPQPAFAALTMRTAESVTTAVSTDQEESAQADAAETSVQSGTDASETSADTTGTTKIKITRIADIIKSTKSEAAETSETAETAEKVTNTETSGTTEASETATEEAEDASDEGDPEESDEDLAEDDAEDTADTATASSAEETVSQRQKIVEYAMQFVGGRYVYGGSNPNSGVDCSGFTSYVLKQMAGISLAHSSRSQATQGTSISLADAKPGDLVFYATGKRIDHVALYIGNGKIVHAANARKGIVVSSVNHRTPVRVVNVLGSMT